MTIDNFCLNTASVAELLNIDVQTVRRYLWESRAPGRRYNNNQFPAPDFKSGGKLFWKSDRAPEILAWKESRLGRGARPKRTSDG